MPLKPSDGAGAYVKDFRKSKAPQFKGKSDKKKQQMAIAAYLDDKDDQKESTMDKFKKHVMYDPKTGKAYTANKKADHERMDKMGYTHEKPKLDEAPRRKRAPKMTGDSFAIQRAKDAELNKALGRTKTGRKKPVRTMTSTQRSLASMQREEVELDEATDKSTERLKMLVRLGMMDKKNMAKIIRALDKMKEGKPVPPAERKILFSMLNELIGMITGDDTMFAKARKSVKEDKDPEEYDKEGAMMKGQLRQICSANEKLMKMVGDDDNLPEWVQSKVTKATDYIRSVRDYLESEKNESVKKEFKSFKGFM